MYKKKCPKCGEYTYSANKEIWKCQTCGNHIDEIEVEKLNKNNIEKYMIGQYVPDEWDDNS